MGSSISTACLHPALDLWLNFSESLCLRDGRPTSADLFYCVSLYPEMDSMNRRSVTRISDSVACDSKLSERNAATFPHVFIVFLLLESFLPSQSTAHGLIGDVSSWNMWFEQQMLDRFSVLQNAQAFLSSQHIKQSSAFFFFFFPFCWRIHFFLLLLAS